MRAIYLADGHLSLHHDYPKPTPSEGEALLRVVKAGICSTDLELVKGYYPFRGVLGHEFVAIVEACPSAPAWIGQRVVSSINFSADCGGRCGLRCPEQCPQRTVLGIVGRDGAFADYVAVPVANLFAVPAGISDNRAVFCEPLAAACRILEQVTVTGRITAVVGPGRLGMLVAQVLAHAGAAVTVIGRNKPSLELAQQLGLPTAIIGRTPTNYYDIVIETTANPAGLSSAVELVRPNGQIVLKSTYSDTPFAGVASVLASIVVKEVTVIGSRCGPFDHALHLLAESTIVTEALIATEYSLDEGVAAFAHAARPSVRKILLTP